MQNLHQMYCFAEELLTECFGKEFSLPIDVLKIAKYLNISVEEIDMEKISNENTIRINYKLIQLSKLENIFTKENEVLLLVERNIPISSKRYAVAYGIAQYLLHKNEKEVFKTYSVLPLCPVYKDDLDAEILALFLLLPVKETLLELHDYIDERKKNGSIPISTEEWIKYLSERGGVSEYYAIQGYQNIRNIACFLYRIIHEDIKISSKENQKLLQWISLESFQILEDSVFQMEHKKIDENLQM